MISFLQSNRDVKWRIDCCISFCSVSSQDLLLHVEWLAIAGEQHVPPVKCPLLSKSILHTEQQLYLSFLQSNRLNDEIWKIIRADQLALDSVLGSLTERIRQQIRDCLLHSSRRVKRQQLVYHLTLIDGLLQNSSSTIDRYLPHWSSMLITCLLYRFEVRYYPPWDVDDVSLDFQSEEDDFDWSDSERAVQSGCIWSIRRLAARTCLKLLQRSHRLIYDVLCTRIIARLIHSVSDPSHPPSVIYAILDLFEQLGPHAIRAFLLPHLHNINPSTMFSSKSIRDVLERIALLINPTKTRCPAIDARIFSPSSNRSPQ